MYILKWDSINPQRPSDKNQQECFSLPWMSQQLFQILLSSPVGKGKNWLILCKNHKSAWDDKKKINNKQCEMTMKNLACDRKANILSSKISFTFHMFHINEKINFVCINVVCLYLFFTILQYIQLHILPRIFIIYCFKRSRQMKELSEKSVQAKILLLLWTKI